MTCFLLFIHISWSNPYLDNIQAHSQCIVVALYASHTVPTNPGPGRHVSAPQHVWTALPLACSEHP